MPTAAMNLPNDGGDLALLSLWLFAVIAAGCWVAKHLP